MSVQELIDILKEVEDKTLPVSAVDINSEDKPNIWIYDVEVSNANDSGYELCGEVRIIGGE